MAKEKFEVTLKKLEDIVADLDSGELSLDDSLKKYEEGVKLTKACSKFLVEAEKKIEILSQDADGAFKLEPFEETGKGKKKVKSKKEEA